MMISLVAQERVLGFALGSALVGIAVLEQRRAIRRSITYPDLAPPTPEANQSGKFSWLKGSDMDIARTWNKAVDGSLAPLIAVLSSRGW